MEKPSERDSSAAFDGAYLIPGEVKAGGSRSSDFKVSTIGSEDVDLVAF